MSQLLGIGIGGLVLIVVAIFMLVFVRPVTAFLNSYARMTWGRQVARINRVTTTIILAVAFLLFGGFLATMSLIFLLKK